MILQKQNITVDRKNGQTILKIGNKTVLATEENIKLLNEYPETSDTFKRYLHNSVREKVTECRIWWSGDYAPDLECIGLRLCSDGVRVVSNSTSTYGTEIHVNDILGLLRYGYVYSEYTLLNYIKSLPKPTDEDLRTALKSPDLVSVLQQLSKFNLEEVCEIRDTFIHNYSCPQQFRELKALYDRLDKIYNCSDEIRKEILNVYLNQVCSWAKIV